MIWDEYIWDSARDMVLSAYALKYLLKVVGDLVERIWGGAGVSLLVCMRGAGF